jgi:hypothetical protein
MGLEELLVLEKYRNEKVVQLLGHSEILIQRYKVQSLKMGTLTHYY